MPLFEIETVAHIIISWAADEQAAAAVVVVSIENERVCFFVFALCFFAA